MLAKSRTTGLGRVQGMLRMGKTAKYENLREIKRHQSKDPIHLYINGRMEFYNVETKEQFIAILKGIRHEIILPTANMFDTVLFEALTGMPYEDHPYLVKLQKRNGATLGHHLFSRFSVTQMTDHIYEYERPKLLSHLVTNKIKTSLLIDESTDPQHKNLLVIMIQGLEDNMPMLWTYSLIQVTDGSGEGIFNAILKEWEKDGLTEYFRENLISFVCDGASKNLGSGKGVAVRLNQFTKSELIIGHCMAHKANLCAKWGIKQHPYMKDMEKFVQKLYRFYKNKGHKRKDHLYATSQELGYVIFELQYVHQIRWISSELWALEVIKNDYPILIQDLMKIALDNGEIFDKDARDQAFEFHFILTSRRFVVMLHFIIDVLNFLSIWSKQLQKANGLLFDKKRFRDTTLENLKNLIYNDGENYEKLKLNIECWGEIKYFMIDGSYTKEESQKKICSEHEIYASPNVRWQGVDLLPLGAEEESTFGHFPMVREIRASSLDTLREKIMEYFPDDALLDWLSYFDPALFPKENSFIMLQGYYFISKESVVSVYKRLGYTEVSGLQHLEKEWENFVLHLSTISAQEYKENIKLDAADFWEIYLRKEEPEFKIQSNLRQLLGECFGLASGTSSVERIFSILGHIQTNQSHVYTYNKAVSFHSCSTA